MLNLIWIGCLCLEAFCCGSSIATITIRQGAADLEQQQQSEEIVPPELLDQFKRWGVKPDRAGIQSILESYLPAAVPEERIQKLIDQLGDEQFQNRVHAGVELLQFSETALPFLKVAVQTSEDLEVRVRARQTILAIESGERFARLRGALRLISLQKTPGFVPVILKVARSISTREIDMELTGAINSTATVADLNELESRLFESTSPLRGLVLPAWLRLVGTKGTDRLIEMATNDESVEFRLLAAIELAKIPHARAVDALIPLLGEDDKMIRARSARALQEVTGQNFEFYAYGSLQKRTEAINRWTNWHESNRASLVLFPYDPSAVPPLLGRVFVTSYTRSEISEFQADGKLLRKFKISGKPMGVCGLADGSVLVCNYSGKTLLKYDSKNKLIWTSQPLPGSPLSVEALANGNLLVGTSSGKKVIELDKSGKTIWKHDTTDRINVAHRTPIGTTLISFMGPGMVREVDSKGKQLWQLKVKKPNGVRRLPNGNTLVCLYDDGLVNEYSPAGKVVRSFKELEKPSRAQRLPDGRTVVYHRKGLRFYDSDGKIEKDISEATGVGSMHYF